MIATVPEYRPTFSGFEGESFNGFVARWAADAHYERMLDITRFAGVRNGNSQTAASADVADLTKLAAEMDVDPSELVRRSTPIVRDMVGNKGSRCFYGIELPATLLETKARRFSPTAFRLDAIAYHRALWDLRLLPICIETGEILLNKCQNHLCDARCLGWRNVAGVDRCEHCIADLSQSATPTVPEIWLPPLRAIAGLFQPSERQSSLFALPKELSNSGAQFAVDLLLRLLPVVLTGLRHDLSSLHLHEPMAVCDALVQCWAIMVGWPYGFHEFARMRVNARSRHHQDGNGGRTIWFLKGRVTKTPQPIRAAIEVLRNSIDVNRTGGREIVANTLSIKEVSKALSTGTADIAAARRAGRLRSVVILENRGLQLRYDRSEIMAVRFGIANRIGFDKLRSHFGISHCGLEQIAALNLIEFQQHPYFKCYGILQTTKQSLAQFEASLRDASCDTPPENHLSLMDAMKSVRGLKPWGPIFEMLLSGSMNFHLECKPGALAKRILIAGSNMQSIFDARFDPPLDVPFAFSTRISKHDAMEVLNLGPKQITELFADTPTIRGGRTKTIDLDRVLNIADECVTSRELSGRLGESCQIIQSRAVRLGIPLLGVAGYCRKTAEARMYELAGNSRPTFVAVDCPTKTDN